MDLNSTRAHNRRMYFDRKHQADGGSYFSLNGGQPSVKDLYGNDWKADKIDRNTTPAQMLKEYYDYFTDCLNSTSTMGYFATISGNHDHLRLNMGARNTPDQLKVMLTWVLSMPLPIIYYGDEIGMRSLVDMPNVEGANHNGKERSGARSPMQWSQGPTAGFSTCSQDNDPESMLNWVRSLIKFRAETEAFWADSKFIPIFNEAQPYPMVFLRSNGKDTYLIALNPTGERKTLTLSSEISDYKCVTKGAKGLVAPAKSLGKATYKSSGKGDVLTLGATSALIVRL